MATDRQIELAAIAIRDAFGNRNLDRRGRPAGRAWSDLPEQLREAYRQEARAALAAYEAAMD